MRIQQLDAAAIVVHQRREPPANAHVDAHARIGRVSEIHVVALVVRDHLQRQLVVIAQEQAPLAVIGNGRRLRHDVRDGQPVFLPQRHVNARHQREMKRHVALIAVAEIWAHVGGPLVRFRQDQSIRIIRIDRRANRLDHGVRLGQIFAVGTVALAQVRNRVHAQRVHAHVEPEAHGLQHFFDHQRIVEVQIRLMREEAMPVVRLGRLVPRPVRFFGIGEDDARFLVSLVVVGPHVHVALRRTRRRQARAP